MITTAPQSDLPHYLLLSESNTDPDIANCGSWRFLLEEVNGQKRIEAQEDEPGVRGERLQLLSAVRGLEAIEEPARVTLVTSSKYVGRGIRQGLPMWRENNWSWEHFGIMTPIKNQDLWQRIDHALEYHTLECRFWNFETLMDTPSVSLTAPSRRAPSLSTARAGFKGLTQLIADRFSSIGLGNAYGYA